ncbi:MAG: hypothetical protein R3C20_22760 [Planctomycetaceae bacterium]
MNAPETLRAGVLRPATMRRLLCATTEITQSMMGFPDINSDVRENPYSPPGVRLEPFGASELQDIGFAIDGKAIIGGSVITLPPICIVSGAEVNLSRNKRQISLNSVFAVPAFRYIYIGWVGLMAVSDIADSSMQIPRTALTLADVIRWSLYVLAMIMILIMVFARQHRATVTWYVSRIAKKQDFRKRILCHTSAITFAVSVVAILLGEFRAMTGGAFGCLASAFIIYRNLRKPTAPTIVNWEDGIFKLEGFSDTFLLKASPHAGLVLPSGPLPGEIIDYCSSGNGTAAS